MPVERLQRETTNEQFEKWQIYLRMEPNLFHREDYYFMLLIRTVQGLFTDSDPSADLGKSLLRFEAPERVEEESAVTYRRRPIADDEPIPEPPPQQTSPRPKPKKDYYAGHIPVGPGTKGILLGMLGLDPEGKPLKP
jgi:hypothetical protein